MSFDQRDSNVVQQKNDTRNKNQGMTTNNCETPSKLEKEVSGDVTRSQSTASMMMELSALPISGCGATNDIIENPDSVPAERNPPSSSADPGVPGTSTVPLSSSTITTPTSTVSNPSLPSKQTQGPSFPKNELPTKPTQALLQNNHTSSETKSTPEGAMNSQSNQTILAPATAALHRELPGESDLPSTKIAPQHKQIQNLSSTPTSQPSTNTTDPPTSIPLKATQFSHLSAKYKNELEYMLVEFRKLERQLLSGHSGSKNGMENHGSRERREKLHSFILHLEDTKKQIESGCQKQQQNELLNASAEDTGLQSEDDRRKRRKIEEEENVQKLEEHILANLLPVKTRLVKQLTAQGRAVNTGSGGGPNKAMSGGSYQSSRNVPVPRGYPQPQNHGPIAFSANNSVNDPSTSNSSYTIGPPQAPLMTGGRRSTESQYGRPLGGNKGSSLTKKLHGQTLGNTEDVGRPSSSSPDRKTDTLSSSAAGSSRAPTAQNATFSTEENRPTDELSSPQQPKRKILHAGLAPGSNFKAKISSIAAAAGTDAASAAIYDNYEHDRADTQSYSDTTTSQFSEVSTQPINGSPHITPTPTTASTVPTNISYPVSQHQRKVNVPNSVGSNPPIARPNKQSKANPTTYYPSKPVSTPMSTSIIVPPAATSRKNPAITKKIGLPSTNLSKGPASAAADAVATSITKPPTKHASTHPTTQMPPPLPPASNDSISHKIPVPGVQQNGANAAVTERRKRRLERRRRRRKRRQARLRAVTEALKANSPMALSHHRNGNSMSSSQYHHPDTDSRDGDRFKSGLHHGAHGMKSVGGNALNNGSFPKIRTVEYICSLCNEQYAATCEYNPWWALTQEDCPKCRKTQVS